MPGGGQGEAVRVPQPDSTLLVLSVGAEDELMPSLLALTDAIPTGAGQVPVNRFRVDALTLRAERRCCLPGLSEQAASLSRVA